MRRAYVRMLSRCLMVATTLFALGCDPGYRLKPVAWTQQPGSGNQWSRDFDGFSLRTRSLGGLVGEWWLYPTFEVLGNSERVTLKGASLQTAKDRYLGAVDPSTASAAPGGGVLSVHWDFGRDHPAPEILGERAEIVLDIDAGSRPYTVRIEYERMPCC
jgi:hypothetical protein